MRTIIVFGGNHHNTLGLIRSIGEKGYPVVLLLEKCNLTDCNLRFSKYIQKIHYLNDDEEALTILKEQYCNKDEKAIIFCSSDAAICLLDKNLSKIEHNFIIFNIHHKEGAINHYMDKLNTFPMAEQSGINIIKTWHISSKDDIPEDMVYPCLTKPNSSLGGLKADMVICYSKQELKANLKEGIDFLVQEYIEKDYELNIIGVSLNHGKDVILPGVIRKLRDHIHYQSMYMRLEDFNHYPSLNIDNIKKFIYNLGYEGLFSVELLCKDDKYYFLEVNMRNDGCGYIHTAAGVNLPYLWIKAHSQATDYLKDECTISKTPFYLMNDYDFKNIRFKQVGFFCWIHQAIHCDTFFIFQLKDIKPFGYLVWRAVVKVFSILVGKR